MDNYEVGYAEGDESMRRGGDVLILKNGNVIARCGYPGSPTLSDEKNCEQIVRALNYFEKEMAL